MGDCGPREQPERGSLLHPGTAKREVQAVEGYEMYVQRRKALLWPWISFPYLDMAMRGCRVSMVSVVTAEAREKSG
jgi:hypothetical protein